MRLIFSKKIYAGMLAGLGLFFANLAQAAITCAPYDAIQVNSVPISPGAISVGPDMPLGSIIYTMRPGLLNATVAQIECTSTVVAESAQTTSVSLGIESAPYPLSSWSGSPFAGAVYTTNVPGIGFVAALNVFGSGTFPAKIGSPALGGKTTIQMPPGLKRWQFGIDGPFFIHLIKIGTTPVGSYTFNASSFPTIIKFWPASSTVAGFPITTARITFTGSITVSAKTCATPDVNVDLGSHDIPTMGQNTAWVAFPIKLTNCPTFTGYFNEANPVVRSGTTTTVPTSTNNQFGLRLTPASDVIDATNGIMAVTPSANAATGVGIQIASGTAVFPELFNFLAEKKFAFDKTGTTTVTIPMLARYIKTNTTVTPGRADGKATFTINYY